MNETKKTQQKCSKCGEVKDIGEFRENKNIKNGYVPWCKECKKKYQQEYYKDPAHRKRHQEYQREYHKNPSYQKYQQEYYQKRMKNSTHRFLHQNHNKKYFQKLRTIIDDRYIIGLIRKNYEKSNITIKSEDIPSDLITLYREHIITQRKIKDALINFKLKLIKKEVSDE